METIMAELKNVEWAQPLLREIEANGGLCGANMARFKWLKRLPHPFPPRDRTAGYRYDLSILQAEFSLTQVLDQPVTGRIFFGR